MKNLWLYLAAGVLAGASGIADDKPDPAATKVHPPLATSELSPTLDGSKVTVQFTVTGLDGVAQFSKPGQASTFVIEARTEDDTTSLTVWIEGELANVLDRLQMSYLQLNQIRKGTRIVATGKLDVSQDRTRGKSHYTLTVNKWRNFRIVDPDSADNHPAE